MNQKKSYESPPILVVDDDKDFLNSVEFILHSDEITNVECYEDGRDVMSLLERKKYSLILLDLVLPHVSGEELLQKIVAKYPEIPVIILTGENDVKTAVACMKFGALDYLVKPFESSRLLKAVRNSLDIDFLLRKGKAQLVIARVAPVIEGKRINKGNVDLFYALGQAYEKIEDFVKAADLYRDIAKFNPRYPGIQKKLKKIEKLKDDIIKIYHRDRYDIKKEVGRGGIGVVYRAKDKKLGRMVALKILNQSPRPKKRDIDRFISEAKKIAKLKHANIVRVHDYGQIENDYFISMEFIEGMHLETLIKKRDPIPIPDILIISKELFTALKHSHRKGVIHRDIKPKNIMINHENEVKVVDFGIAILRGEITRENRDVIYGTPFYMSPEQITNSTTDHLSDIYSAGVTLFHMVTGSIPFKGSSFEEIMRGHLIDPVPSIKEYRNDAPEKLIQIIKKCMEKNKEDRYQKARQVLEEIDEIRDDKGKSIITDKTKLKIFETTDVTPLLPEDKLKTIVIAGESGSSNRKNLNRVKRVPKKTGTKNK